MTKARILRTHPPAELARRRRPGRSAGLVAGGPAVFGDELGQGVAELVDAVGGVGAADADGDGGVGGVVGGRSSFGGGAGGGVDTAAQRDEVARVGAVQAVDGEIAQERAGVGEQPFGQAFGEGLADLVPVAVAHRAAAEPVGPSVGTDRDGGGERAGLLGRLCLWLLAGRRSRYGRRPVPGRCPCARGGLSDGDKRISVGGVPVLHHVQALVDLPAQFDAGVRLTPGQGPGDQGPGSSRSRSGDGRRGGRR